MLSYGNGNGNIVISKSSFGKRLNIDFLGVNCTLVIGEECNLSGSVTIEGDGSLVVIGDRVTCLESTVYCGSGKRLIIGSGSILNEGSLVINDDSIDIFDINKAELINPSKDTVIGANVFIGDNASVLKGVVIGDGSYVLEKSIVLDSMLEENVLISGVPGAIVETNIYWIKE